EAALRSDDAQFDLVAEAAAQRLVDIAQRVDEAELEALHAAPELTGEQILPIRELRAAPRFHPVDEHRMDLRFHGLDALDVLRLFGQERVEGRLAAARSVDAPLDAELVQRTDEAEAGIDHP